MKFVSKCLHPAGPASPHPGPRPCRRAGGKLSGSRRITRSTTSCASRWLSSPTAATPASGPIGRRAGRPDAMGAAGRLGGLHRRRTRRHGQHRAREQRRRGEQSGRRSLRGALQGHRGRQAGLRAVLRRRRQSALASGRRLRRHEGEGRRPDRTATVAAPQGGVYLCFQDFHAIGGTGSDIVCQRFGADGRRLWTDQGVRPAARAATRRSRSWCATAATA